MIPHWLEMYESGAMTGYQVMIECLQILDPSHPDAVLSQLPEEVLDELMAYARRYDARRPHSATLIPPPEDQVRAAERWILSCRAGNAQRINR